MKKRDDKARAYRAEERAVTSIKGTKRGKPPDCAREGLLHPGRVPGGKPRNAGTRSANCREPCTGRPNSNRRDSSLENETEHANLILWPLVFEAQRRLVLTANMIACRGKLQREGEVIHVIGEHLTDLSDMLRGVGERDDTPFPLRQGHGNEARHGSAPDSREKLASPRDIYVRDTRVVPGGIKVPTRDFR